MLVRKAALIALFVMMTSINTTPLFAAQRYQNKVLLNLNTYLQTTDYTCGPAAVMVVLNYYGGLPAHEMNAKTELRIAKEMNAIPHIGGGTSAIQLSDWLNARGFRVSIGQDISANLLIDNIQQGRLVIVSYDEHWIVAKGFTLDQDGSSRDDQIIFYDPSTGTTTISARTIDFMWGSAHLPHTRFRGNGEYIIVTP